jgi:ComF family protein
VEGQEAHLCGECLGDPPAYEAHVSAFVYEGPVRHLVLLFKERLRYPLAKLLGRALAKRARSAWPQERWDAVVYVPSPTRRRLRRGFEPAGLIALEASRVLGIQCRRWIRVRRSPAPQKGLTSAGRRRNLQGVFAADKARVRGLRLLLVDDVRTTGATLREAARVLTRAGATVHAATFAMVLARPLDLMGGAEGNGPPAEAERLT